MVGHLHPVVDTDVFFEIDSITRKIQAKSGKSALIQGDHNSERFTFKLPRWIDGHDMTLCNSVQVHYINNDSTKQEQSKGVYEVEDMKVDAENEDSVVLSWLIAGNATKYTGDLSFLVKFKCVGEDGAVEYVWNTAVYSGISISDGIDNGEAVAEEYADILEQWRNDLFGGAYEIPEFDLTGMGLPAIPLDGERVGVNVDTTDITEALRKGLVKIGFAVDAGEYGTVTLTDTISGVDLASECVVMNKTIYVLGSVYVYDIAVYEGFIEAMACGLQKALPEWNGGSY